MRMHRLVGLVAGVVVIGIATASGSLSAQPGSMMMDYEDMGGGIKAHPGAGQRHGMGMMGSGMGHMGMMTGMRPCMGGMPGGGMGHMGMMSVTGDFHMLELDDAQRAEIRKIRSQLRKESLPIMGRVMDEQDKLCDLYAQERRDAKAIGSVYAKIFDMQRQMIEASIEAHNRAREVLTDEQRARAKTKDVRRGMMGGQGRDMGMMGGRMMEQ